MTTPRKKQKAATQPPSIFTLIADGLDASTDGRGWGAEHEQARLLADASPALYEALRRIQNIGDGDYSAWVKETAGEALALIPPAFAPTITLPGGAAPREEWQPQFSPWRHGGWYVDNLRYPSGAVGCVSRNYPDKKWRIACDPRPFDERPTFPSRVAAARGERDLIAALRLAQRLSEPKRLQ